MRMRRGVYASVVLTLLGAGCQLGPQLDPRLSGEVVQLETPPPPLSGGTLAVLHDGVTAVVADPDRDRIVLVDLAARAVRQDLALPAHSEPGRIAEDTHGRVHVVLRGAASLLSLDPSTGATEIRHVCDMPRGVAFDDARDELLVACRTGELVSLPAAGGAASVLAHPADDLRDVIVAEGRRFVTTFRTAQLLELDADGTVLSTRTPASVTIQSVQPDSYSPSVAWRATYVPSAHAIAMVHQRGRVNSIAVARQRSHPTPGSSSASASTAAPPGSPYAAALASRSAAGTPITCRSGVVHSAVTFFGLDGTTSGGAALTEAGLPLDVAVHDGRVAVVAAANQAGVHSVLVQGVNDLALTAHHADGCAQTSTSLDAQRPTSIAYDGAGELVILERDPAALLIGNERIALGGASVFDTGQALFHGNTGSFDACASCHPEGGDDGRTWTFDDVPRRTQALGGGVLATAPFHWDGGESDFPTLVSDVFVRRMGGPALSGDQTSAFGHWVDTIPTPRARSTDATAVARGAALFAGPADCVRCHSGEHLTNDQTMDVGTGGAFQTPSLIGVSHRLPLMHDGCARTLEDRFIPTCGGTMHGNVDGLSASDRADLIAYLRSL
jgi:mono/diheme cytochrome c family protein